MKKRTGRGTSFLFLSLLSLLPLHTQISLKHEVQAAWITAVYGLNWPRTKATTPADIRRQKEELIDIPDRLKEANFNIVLFQTCTRGDVLCRSNIEPSNSVLTSKIGGNPEYNPLAFVVKECHKRGMECHVWMVTIPLEGKKHVASPGRQSVTKRQQDICVPYENEYFFNSGHPATKEYLMKLVREVVNRYDMGRVHFDYLCYPESAPRFSDSYDFHRYGKGRPLAQWRRDSLTDIVRYVYNGVKVMEPWVKVNTCPAGKYRDILRYSSRGWNAFLTVYQSPQGRLGESIQDQIYPMMYFRGSGSCPSTLDWQEQSNGRYIVPGLGIHFLHPDEGSWTPEEVERWVHFIRTNYLADEMHYRVKYLMDNTQEAYNIPREQFYQYPVLQPPVPWTDNVAPIAPSELNIASTGDGYTRFSWKAATDNDRQNALMYIVYASNTYPAGITDPESILVQNLRGTHYTYTPVRPWTARKYFAVTAVGRCRSEGEACK